MTVGKTAKGVSYVSVLVLIWGTAASLVDYILLKREIYASFSIGQGFTFVGYGVAAAYLAVNLHQGFSSRKNLRLPTDGWYSVQFAQAAASKHLGISSDIKGCQCRSG